MTTLQLVSPRNDVWETSAEIPYWWRHYPGLGIGIDWSWRERNLFHPISRRTTQIWVVNVISMREFLQSLLSDVISWWRREVSTFFSGYLRKRLFVLKKNSVILRDFCKESSLWELTPISALVSRKRRLLL